jgi:hypothetical protein
VEVKVLYFGEGVAIPKTPFDLGVSLISVWINNSGFTSASNDLGAVGFVCLDAPPVDVPVSVETEAAFGNLHGQIVQFEISPSKFIRNGGIARIKLTLPTNGDVAARSVEFTVSGCRGVALATGVVSFAVEMAQLDRSVAELDGAMTDEDVVAIVDAAPSEGDEIPA